MPPTNAEHICTPIPLGSIHSDKLCIDPIIKNLDALQACKQPSLGTILKEQLQAEQFESACTAVRV